MRNTGSSSTYGFMGCANLVKAALPQGLVTISRNLFTDTKIDSLTIPESVTSIGFNAFLRCTSTRWVKVMNETPPSQSVAFANCSFPIYVPDGSVEAYKSAWSAYASRIHPLSDLTE